MEINQWRTNDLGIAPSTNFRLKTIGKVWWSIYLPVSILMIFGFVVLLYKAYFIGFFWILTIFVLPAIIAFGVLAYSSIANITMRLSITN
ncbi:MAG: hypothetical protein HOP37_01395 [Cyclobacteriaceae bacterium]|nr:hypothetical protein [Cyclobacteriaceae bacterium]